MKKSVSMIILVVAFLASCQTKPISEPSIVIVPTNTIEPIFNLVPSTQKPSNTPVPPTPTEIFIDPDYLAGLKKSGFDKQFPLTTTTDLGTNKEVKVTFCAFDFKGQNKVKFEYSNLIILRVSKCYFVDIKGKNEFVTVPLLYYNKDLDKYYLYSALQFVDGKLNPSEAYFDGVFSQLIDRWKFDKYALLHFQFSNFGRLNKDKDYVAFFEKAVNLFGEPSEKFYNEGDVSEFQDFTGAENFIFPSSMWSDRGE